MNTAGKIGGYMAALVLAFGGAVGVGRLAGPFEFVSGHAGTPPASPKHDGGHTEEASGAAEVPGGLMVSQDGYTLALAQRSLPSGRQTVLFRILGPDGKPVIAYEPSHEKDLHLIAVRRDLTGFQHLHPTLSTTGTWTTQLALTPGEWRMFADFIPAGKTEGLTLGADLHVAGDYRPQRLPAASRTAEVGDYTVALRGDLVPGVESELTLNVARDGVPVTDLQPYLGAYGHLVALRDGDLAYLHVHPAGVPGDGATSPGPDVTFFTTAPSAGRYRLFLDFRHEGVVRTAEFTAEAGPAGSAPQDAPEEKSAGRAGHADDHGSR